jgi:P22_AR N-terminal domain.
MSTFKPALINFFGEPIAVIETEVEIETKDGLRIEPVLGVVARRLVEQLGLDWPSQLAKLKDDEDNRYGCFEAKAESTDGRTLVSTIIPLTSVNAFLFSVNRNKISPDDMIDTKLASGEIVRESKRAKLIRYQDECAMALHDYWIHGAAMNFRANPSELDSQKTYDILQTSRKRYNNRFNSLVASVVEAKGHRGEAFENEFKEFAVKLETEVRDSIMACMNAQELDFDKGLIRKMGETGLREITGMEAMHISILENCVCDLIGLFRRKELGDGENYAVIIEALPEYFDDYLNNVGNQVLTMRSTYNRGKGLFVQ